MQIKIDTKKKEITVLETVTITDLLNGIASLSENINPDELSIIGDYDNYFQPYYPLPTITLPDITCASTNKNQSK